MELLYREAEYFTVLRALLGNDLSLAEQEKLTAGWKHILTNQFHDIIPGSSIFEVYEDSKKDYEWIATQGEEVEAGFIAEDVYKRQVVNSCDSPQYILTFALIMQLRKLKHLLD